MDWTDLHARIDAELALEGQGITDANHTLMLIYANEAVDRISEAVGPQVYTWTSPTLTFVNHTSYIEAALPATFMGPIDQVRYDGYEIEAVDLSEFTEYTGSLSTNINDPVYNLRGRSIRITGPTASMVEIDARKALDHYVIATPALDPLALFATASSNLPVYYILSRFSWDATSPVQANRQAQNMALWTGGLAALAEAEFEVAAEPWSF